MKKVEDITEAEIEDFKRQVQETAAAFVQPTSVMATIACGLQDRGYMQTAVLQSMMQSFVLMLAAITEAHLKQDQQSTDQALIDTFAELLTLSRQFREETGVCKSKEAPLQ